MFDCSIKQKINGDNLAVGV